MKLLSLRLCGHDSNFSYFDGNKIHYYRSERDFQIKHHKFDNLWEWRDVVKRVWNLDYREVDEIAIILEPYKYNLPGFQDNIYPYIDYDLFPAKCNVYRLDHHYAHTLSAWMLSDKQPDIHFVIDGCGDADTDTPWSVIKNDKLIARGDLSSCDSIGRLMITMGDFLGIKRTDLPKPCDGLDTAGKVMSLQSYGKIDYNFKKQLAKYSMENSEKIFDFDKWIKFVGDERLAAYRALDWAASVHDAIGDLLINFFKQYASKTDTIVYTGGVAQNIVWNTRLKNEFPNLIIPPHCADDGLSLGGIEFLRRKNGLPPISMPQFPYCQSDQTTETPTIDTIKQTAKLLSQGKIVAWYQGNGEIGPRALGNRSILMDPRITNGKEKINKIKKRENFRPFGASMLSNLSKEYFDIDFEDKYMLYTYKVKDKNLQAITHIDDTCRVQCVDDSNPIFKDLLTEFYKLTGYAILLNTSLNVNKKPIAGYMDNAFELFENSEIDYLVVGNIIYSKEKI
jgi:carbamoyltransferase